MFLADRPLCLFVIALLLTVAACSTSPTSGASGSASSPAEAIDQMGQFEKKGDYVAYVNCMTDRGRGWLIGELANVLLMDANIQPVDPAAGAGSRSILEKYKLNDLVQQSRTWKSDEDGYQQLARKYSSRLADLLADYRSTHQQLFMPGDYKIVSTTAAPDRAELTLSDPKDAGSPYADITLKVSFVLRHGKWLFDGGVGG